MKLDIYNIKIGDEITVEKGLELANHFNFVYLFERLKEHPERYKTFTFDGCSMLPDEMLGLFTGCYWKDITYFCCLPHDICYAYGEKGNLIEKDFADMMLKVNLINKAHMKERQAECFLKAVKIGGAEEFGLSFSWSFASRKEEDYATIEYKSNK